MTGRIKQIKLSAPGVGGAEVQLQATAEPDWTAPASDMLNLLDQAQTRWLIYIDELPIFLFNLIRKDSAHGVARVRRFLDWFRNDVRNLPAHAHIRWLVSGSVGLDTLVQHHGMADTINSLKQESLLEFRPEQALALLQALHATHPLGLSDEDLATVVAEIQWCQPYYLQQAFQQLRVAPAGGTGPERIQRALNDLAEPGQDNDFHHWESRLALQLGTEDGAHARALLTHAARLREGASATSLLELLHQRLGSDTPDEAARHHFLRLRDILLRDAYWGRVETGGKPHYRFRLEPLRRWWLRRNEL